LEISNDPSLSQAIHTYLLELVVQYPELDSLITDGLKMMKEVVPNKN
jgi:hypothetical protein